MLGTNCTEMTLEIAASVLRLPMGQAPRNDILQLVSSSILLKEEMFLPFRIRILDLLLISIFGIRI